ncbi:MAG TPA: CHAD domain-containing protein, partial [Bacteroidetes bacterium]|nr:CHAD domain-containing protein [Bacteroidota bacterium]
MKTLQNTINFAFNIMGMGSPATNGFLNYFNRRTEEFLRRVRNVKNTLDDENIHQLRVEVKKIRSVLKLLD